MTDLFVSYKAEDRARVAPLVHALEADGYKVWWDAEIGGGEQWREEICRHLDAARLVIVVWSKRSVGPHGNFVRDEATRALRRHAYLPVNIDKVDPPLGFGETQSLNLVGWRGDPGHPKYRAALGAVKARLGERQPEMIDGVRGNIVSRRTAMIGGGAVIAVAAAGSWALLKPRSAKANSIAVLPFANLSGDPAQAYFSDGIAEELRSALSRISGLKVVGRTSSEAVREDDAETAARKLRVVNILTGSVRQTPSTVRVSAELVDGRTGITSWSQDYDRSPGDAIKIQTDIAENVARALSSTLGKAVRAAIALGGTSNAEAQKFFLQAIEAGRSQTEAGFQRAFKLADAAIALDRNYADAYAWKAFCEEFFADNFADTLDDVRKYRASALSNAHTANRIAPDLPMAHLALTQYYGGMLDMARAVEESRRALELAPSDARMVSDRSIILIRSRQTNEALRLADKGIALDPLDASAYRRRFLVLFYARRYGEALKFVEDLQKRSPELFNWFDYAGLAAAFNGELDRAQSYLASAPIDHFRRLVAEADVLVRRGRKEAVGAKIDALKRLYGDTINYQLGQVYAQLGDKERAFAALERAWSLRDAGLGWTQVDPHLDPLRSDSRLDAIIKRLGFPA